MIHEDPGHISELHPAVARSPRFSALAVGSGLRLLIVAGVLTALWLSVYWALS